MLLEIHAHRAASFPPPKYVLFCGRIIVHTHTHTNLSTSLLIESISSPLVCAPLHKRKKKKKHMQDKVTLFVNLFLNLESVQKNPGGSSTQPQLICRKSTPRDLPLSPSLLIFSCILYKESIGL